MVIPCEWTRMDTLERKLLGLAGTLAIVATAAVGFYGFVDNHGPWTEAGVDAATFGALAVAVGFVVALSALAVSASHRVETSYW